MQTLVLKNLKVDNVFNLKAIDITPNDAGVTLVGKNGSGKSSVLNSIDVLVRGMKFAPEKVIREGQEKGVIEGDFGEFKVKRTITDKSMRLEITTADGLSPKKPQEYLDHLYGKQFDLVEVIGQKPSELRKTLMDLIGVDVDGFDQRIKVIYDERTHIGRDGQSLKGQLDGLRFVDGIEEKEVDPAELLAQLRAAQAHNGKRDIIEREKTNAVASVVQLENTRELMLKDIERKQAQIDQLKNEIAGIQIGINEKTQKVIHANAAVVDAEKRISEFVPMDTTSIESQISGCQTKNQTIRQNKMYLDVKAKVESKRAEYEAKTKEIQAIENEKKAILQKAQFPIEGLSFGENCVLYNGVPLDQASDAQKILVSMSIFMALNPGFKIIRINRGALIDNENLKLASEFAKSKGYQAWIEEVSERESNDGRIVITIEDGEIKHE